MAQIEIENLTKTYSTDAQTITAVDDVSFTVDDGEFVCFVGPSGCGKTTLLRSIAGLETPTDGDITIGHESVVNTPPQHRQLAFVFQDIVLYPHMKVRKNMAYPLKLAGASKEERREAVDEAADILQIRDLLDKYPGELSGGQQQRVAIGRSIVRSPRAFLLDEPMSDLDAKLKKEMRVELQRIQKEIGGTMVYVTHDQEEAMTLSDRMVVMNDGRIQQYDDPQTIYHRPANRFVAQFIGSPEINLLPAVVDDGGESLAIEGTDWSVPMPVDESPDQSEVTLGFRPRHTTVRRPSEAEIVGEIALVESIGDDAVLYVDTEAGEVRVVVDLKSTEFDEGDRVGVSIDRSYLFDPRTGERVARGDNVEVASVR